MLYFGGNNIAELNLKTKNFGRIYDALLDEVFHIREELLLDPQLWKCSFQPTTR